ncbi:regulatory signaling modulator protein AmpE [Reinekea marina]|uniref:Regulatory signaling modulator protein AmpE n=1 Tax=Reinekea marina TaxID=1310421 RepID=A0ABV7WQ43_9GAMM|nr:regulatory signaling modulator protein AmpE [Reinekea marina]MDN3650505.1 regulatory signaling modulator protein AmpE [Reinekea marina]
MDFIAIIVAYLVSISLSGHGEPLTGIVIEWRDFLQKRGWNAKITVALFALIPTVVLALLTGWKPSGIITFVISVGVLLLAFKSGDQPEVLEEFTRKQEAEDDQGAWQLAVEELGLAAQMYEPGDEAIEEGVQAGLAYLFLERFFVSVFWFIAFGAPGVLLVWLISTALNDDQQSDVFFHRVKHALYWIPVRLMTFTLALVGDFNHCFSIWLKEVKDFERDDRVLLVTCLKAAVGERSVERLLPDSMTLLRRSQYAWLVALAVNLILG